MSKIRKNVLSALFLSFFVVVFISIAAYAEEPSPYGAHSHIYHPWEWQYFPRNYDVMKQCGLGWMRTDFLWRLVEKKPGVWDFSQYDQIVNEAEKKNIHVLGILSYSVPWATPAWEHPKQWAEYVSRTVSRYKGKVRHWEVWNEQNISGFWKNPDPEDYTRFLKLTYETAKKADPDAVILYGGTAGIPMEFIEQSLKADAGKWFDIMNIHPYRHGLDSLESTRRFASDIANVRTLLTKYGQGDKPIWITDMGWTDFVPGKMSCRDFVSAVFKEVSPEKPVKKVAILYDPQHYVGSLGGNGRKIVAQLVPSGTVSSFVSLEEIARLNPGETPFLLMPRNEICPSPYIDSICAYVRAGGTLIFTYGIPCYYTTKMKNGYCEKVPGENSATSERRRLRIDTHVWWENKNIPKEAKEIAVVPPFNDFFKTFDPKAKADRFFGSKFLKSGDKIVPIIMGKSDGFSEPVAVVYRFNSDFKGNIAIYSLYDPALTGVTAEEMGIFLPQAYLIAFASGIERFFMYQFQAREVSPTEREHHFGLVHKDLSPKSSYIALAALTKARPAGSVGLPGMVRSNICVLSWKRPDGKKGWAVWNPQGPIAGHLKISGRVVNSFDNLGQPVDAERYEISDKILYVIGPDDIDFVAATR